MIVPQAEKVFRDLIGILEEIRVPYMVMGGFAVCHWAVERATFDVDFTISLEDKDRTKLFDALDARGYTVPDPYRKGFTDQVKEFREFKVQWYAGGRSWDADFFLITVPYQEEAFSRRVRVRLLGLDVWLISAEDLILHKLYAGRPKDIADVVDVLSLARTDLAYIRRWAERMKVVDLLEKCQAAVGEM